MPAKNPKDGFTMKDIEHALHELYQEDICELVDELTIEDADERGNNGSHKPLTQEQGLPVGMIYITTKKTWWKVSLRGEIKHSPRVRKALTHGGGIILALTALYEYILAHQEQLQALERALFTKY